MTATTIAAPRRLRAFERAAFAGVWTREVTLFRRYWASSSFGGLVEPTINLLAFGFGFGALVSTVDGVPYIQYVGTGIVATAVLFSSVFAGMFDTYVKRYYMKTYDGILATPVDVPELFWAEATWIATKSGVYGVFPLVVAMVFGLPPSWGMLAIPFIGALTGLGFAFMGMWFSGIVPSIDSFSYVQSALVTPMFLLAGTFFPISGLPQWAQYLAQINPLYHCVQLVRHAVFGFEVADLWNLGFLLAFGVVMWRIAINRMERRLIN